MGDANQRMKPPEQRASLAEMAARAAQRTTSTRPPPPPIPLRAPSAQPGFDARPPAPPSFAPQASWPPPGHASSRTGGSGLIHLQALQPPPVAPVLHNVDL